MYNSYTFLSFHRILIYQNQKVTSKTFLKLDILSKLSKQFHKEREEIIAWANEQACLETLKYKSEKDGTTVMIISPSNRLMDYHKQTLFSDDIFFSNPFIMDLRWILSAEKSTAANL